MSKARAAWLLALLACAEPDAPPRAGEPVVLSGDAATADRIARNFVDGYYRQFPEEAFEVGYRVPGAALGDRSLEALAAWQAREDAWLDSLRALDARASSTFAVQPVDNVEVQSARRSVPTPPTSRKRLTGRSRRLIRDAALRRAIADSDDQQPGDSRRDADRGPRAEGHARSMAGFS